MSPNSIFKLADGSTPRLIVPGLNNAPTLTGIASTTLSTSRRMTILFKLANSLGPPAMLNASRTLI